MKILSQKKTWFLIALGNFFLAACIGALLRFAFVAEVSWMNYRHFLHGHSHVAMLGWIYLGFFILFISTFLSKELQKRRAYKILFWLTQFAVIGMIISFPIQGYAGASIFFSTLHVLLSYGFVYRFLKDTKLPPSSPAFLLAKAALGFMVLSTLGLWAMPPIIINGWQGNPAYYLSVQFFLHFQLNGWFVFAALALFFSFLEKKGISISSVLFSRFYLTLVGSCFLTYSLYIAWSFPEPILFGINGFAVCMQFLALIFFLQILLKEKESIQKAFSDWNRPLLIVAGSSFLLKIIFQVIIVVPYMATIAYTIRNYVIGFFHLLLLGMISSFLLGYADSEKLIGSKTVLAKFGILLFVAGFVLSEFIIFLQGTLFWGSKGFMPYYYELLFGASFLLPLGIGIYLVSQFQENHGEMG